jgi:hypothetical protein
MDFSYNPTVRQKSPSLFEPMSEFEDDFSVERTTDVAKDAFEKAKASASYGMATIHYGMLLPLKEMTIGLTDEQAINLDLYNKHKKLCSGVEKVQTAYKTYVTAQEAVKNAPPVNNSMSKRAALRNPALTAGAELVKAYDALIQLAISQAEQISVNKTKYLADLHEELDGKTEQHIYNTVNRVRAKGGIESHYDHKQGLKDNYLRFVTEFVSNIRDASLKSGHTSVSDSKAITDAFIQGLATIPELGKNDGLLLIELYAELNNLQANVADAQNEAVEYFREKVEGLMNRPEPITTEDLQKIQFKGISLLSVMKTLDQLNNLKTLKVNLQETESLISTIETKILLRQQFIANRVEFSFDDVEGFLNDNHFNLDSLNDNEPALVDRYREAVKRRNELTQAVEETKVKQEQLKTARTKEMAENKAKIETTEQEIKRLDQEIIKGNLELQKQKQELSRVNKALAADGLGVNPEDSQALIDLRTSILKTQALLEQKNNELSLSVEEKVENRDDQELKLAELNKEQERLFGVDRLLKQQEAAALEILNADLATLQAQKIAGSGEEFKALAQFFEIKGETNSTNRLAWHLDGVLDAESQGNQFRKDLSLKQAQAAILSNRISELNNGMFGHAEKAEIAAQLEANLVIAKQVTLAVGRKIVERADEISNKNAPQGTEGEPALTRVSQLGLVLAAREAELMEKILIRKVNKLEEGLDEKSLSQLVNNGLEKFAPVASKKAVEVVQVSNLENASTADKEFFSMPYKEDSDSEDDIFGRNSSTLRVGSDDEI